jgi:RNA polymerase sigma-70 factor, ECF subfamily
MSLPEDPNRPPPDFDQFRGYLRLLALAQFPDRIRGPLDASDIVQETFVDAHRDWPNFEGSNEHELKAWLRKILIRNLLTALRFEEQEKRDRRRTIHITAKVDQSSMCIEKFLAADQTSPSQCVQRGERYQLLFDALSQLPDDQRQAVMLKHLHGKSLNEIAETMNRSVTAVGGLLRRGMSRLRELTSQA